MSKMSVEKSHRENRYSFFRVIVGVFIGLVVLFVLITYRPYPRERASRIRCWASLRSLGVALLLYTQDHDNVYPTPEKWCDLLVDYLVSEEVFRCPGGERDRCDYAMNPHADPCSAPDVVLLFESSGGWNQFGGQELLTKEHHKGEGCNIFFVDGRVEFVKAEQFEELKWGVE